MILLVKELKSGHTTYRKMKKSTGKNPYAKIESEGLKYYGSLTEEENNKIRELKIIEIDPREDFGIVETLYVYIPRRTE